MPSWSPNWNNVQWDHEAAADAIRALREAADLLERTAYERTRAAEEAQREWRGRYRDEFDGHLTQMIRRAHDLAAEFRGKANEINYADQRAYEEQRNRERERARWQAEKEAEDRARWLREQGLR